MTERKTGANTGFASGGVTCKLGASCYYSSSVLVDSFVLRNPPERKARKRWQQANTTATDNETTTNIHQLINHTMTIYALKGPSSEDYDQDELQEIQKFLSDSIKNGISRFGWSYIDTADLTKLQDKPWQEMDEKEQNCWAKANFLLGVEKGDWVVHINLPYWGACLAGQVSETYSFEQNGNDFGDYRHLLKLDKNSIVEFERNDDRVLPIISSRLKLQGRYWTIQYVDEFLQTMQNVKAESLGKKEDESIGIFYLKKDLSPLLKNITDKIHKTHPAGKLENLIAEVFRKIPSVVDVYEYGRHKGWGTDSGADLIVTYKSGLSISNLEKEEKLVVQVYSNKIGMR